MNRNVLAALVCTTLATAGCGGGGSGGDSTDGDTGGVTTGGATTSGVISGGGTDGGTGGAEDRTRPANGTVLRSSISGSSIVSNGATGAVGPGPIINNKSQPNNFPRLAVGDFWWVNNAFNFNNTRYEDWFQTVELEGTDGNIVPTVEYDWGGEGDLNNMFATVSFPELIFGAKSEAERSGSFAATGLPIENSELPEQINIAYDYSYEQGATASPTGDSNADFSGFNVAIESFWHDSCDIVRNDTAADNQVFELMVWLHIGKRGPVSEGRNGSAGTFTTSDGRTYDVFSKTDAFFRGGDQSNVRNYLAFVAQEESFTGTLPYHEFIQEARDNAADYGTGWRFLQDSDCLGNILLGSETWYGAGSFQWNDVTIEQVY